MKMRFYRMVFVAVIVTSFGAISYRAVNGQCDIDCDKDICLTRFITALSTEYRIDTRFDNSGNPIDCYVEFWDDPSDDYYGHGSAGTKNGRYKAEGGGSQCAGNDKYHKAPLFLCNGIGTWDGNWVFSCFSECQQES